MRTAICYLHSSTNNNLLYQVINLKFQITMRAQILLFFCRDNAAKDKYMVEFTLKKFLKKQRCTLHGYEERNFKYLPKVHMLIRTV